MNVIGHDDEGVEFVVAFAAIVLEGVEEEMAVGFGLEEAAAVIGLSCDEECAVASEACGIAHAWPSVSQGLKPLNCPGGLWHG